MPGTMTAGTATAIQNRLFWRAGAGQASDRSVPSAGTETRHLQMNSDVLSAEQRLRALSLGVAAASVVLSAAPFAEPAEAANVWVRTNIG